MVKLHVSLSMFFVILWLIFRPVPCHPMIPANHRGQQCAAHWSRTRAPHQQPHGELGFPAGAASVLMLSSGVLSYTGVTWAKLPCRAWRWYAEDHTTFCSPAHPVCLNPLPCIPLHTPFPWYHSAGASRHAHQQRTARCSAGKSDAWPTPAVRCALLTASHPLSDSHLLLSWHTYLCNYS